MATQGIDLNVLHIGHGSHPDRSNGLCVMEVVAWYAGEAHSDAPACTSPVLAAYARGLNDAMPDDATRDKYLKPLIIPLVGTTATRAVEVKRAEHFARVAVTRIAPLALRTAGLKKEAETLEALAQDASLTSLRDAAWAAAGDASGDAAWAAAGDAMDAAGAAWNAARAAGDAARAAGDAARAAGDAARAAGDAVRAAGNAARAAGDAARAARAAAWAATWAAGNAARAATGDEVWSVAAEVLHEAIAITEPAR